jgi:ribosomal protein L3 glutamine methyltransferase
VTPSTIADLVATSAARLREAEQAGLIAFGHGTANAHDEAVWLVLWSLGLPLDDLDSVSTQVVSPQAAAKISQLIAQRIATRQPAAYLTREAWLQGVPFYVDERTIVPRSFIAELIAGSPLASDLDEWLSDTTTQVLDLCTGNGSLAVLAAMAWPDVSVDASDLSEDALAVAHINIAKHGLQDRITLLTSDGLQQVQGPYDLILCNPPYVNAQSMAALPAEYLAEPHMALASGSDGMDFCRHLIETLQAQPERYLSEDGVLVLEIGNEREHFERAFPQLPVVWLDTSAGVGPLLLITREALALALAVNENPPT